jgi:hypothetical protein
MWRKMYEKQCHSVPSPLAGEEQGGGSNKHGGCFQFDAGQTALLDFQFLKSVR